MVEHDPKPALEYASSCAHSNGATKEALTLAILAARFEVYFEEAFSRGRFYVETNNRITFFAPALAELLPNSKFIHLVRHPGDFVRSGMRRGYYDGRTVQHQRLDGASKLRGWDNMSRIEKIGWEWSEINATCERFKKTVGSDRLATIKSEEFFGDTAVLHSIFRFLRVEDPFRGKRGQAKLLRLLKRPINAQHSGSFPDYALWSDADKSALRRVAGSIAVLYGFDLT
jgi:hypothetical protein